jgi:hypothetical protein
MSNSKQSPDPRPDHPAQRPEPSEEELAAEEAAIQTTDLRDLGGASGRMGASGGDLEAGGGGGQTKGY